MESEKLPGRVPPHNEDAERAVLGAMMLAPDRIPEAAELVHADDFHVRRHQILFGVLVDMSQRNAKVDLITVGEALRGAGLFQAIGGVEALIEFEQSVTSAAHLAHHAQIVAETAVLRRLISGATDILADAYETRPDGDSVRSLLDRSEARIFQLGARTQARGPEPVTPVLKEALAQIEARTSHRLTGLPTGFHELDEVLGGLNSGDLVIVAARPAMGKTAFALNMLESVGLSKPDCLGGRAPIGLFCSLEMGKHQIMQRMICARGRIDGGKLRTGRLPDDDWQAMNEAVGELAQMQVFIDDSPSLSVMALRGRARRLKAKHGLDLIILDYLQLMTSGQKHNESRQLEISEISRSLKALARELEVPVVALAQLSRAVEGKDRSPRGWPMLSDLRESGSIEQDADVVMMLYRQWYYETNKNATDQTMSQAELDAIRHDATVIIAKHRNGETRDIKLRFFGNILRFENPAPSAAEPIYA
ncbi:MAG: replicative DNA helicase [Planctomycetota bacterium]|nr:replicative DNA helicase [Planctomycetota bacterium]